MAEEERSSKSDLIKFMVRAYQRERSEKKFLRLQQELSTKAVELGADSEEDVDRLVLEGR